MFLSPWNPYFEKFVTNEYVRQLEHRAVPLPWHVRLKLHLIEGCRLPDLISSFRPHTGSRDAMSTYNLRDEHITGSTRTPRYNQREESFIPRGADPPAALSTLMSLFSPRTIDSSALVFSLLPCFPRNAARQTRLFISFKALRLSTSIEVAIVRSRDILWIRKSPVLVLSPHSTRSRPLTRLSFFSSRLQSGRRDDGS